MKFGTAVCLSLAIFLVACGGSSNNDGDSSNREKVIIRGKITYDLVPHANNGALDYANTSRSPVRMVSVQLLDSQGNLLQASNTDKKGNYSAEVPSNTDIRVRVNAQLSNDIANISVTDNTQGNALYTLIGDLIDSGGQDTTRDLHASSGWTGSNYGEERAAAPFAILDSVYQAVELLKATDPSVSLPALELRWSVKNTRTLSADVSKGEIGATHFDGTNIFILGEEDVDTDEYDNSVILHEFGHYIEKALFRRSSVGGLHTRKDQLDSRTAFSEGWCNAFATIASKSDIYSDSVGKAQSSGGKYSIEENTIANLGWYSVNSINQIIYDIYDSNSDDNDNISLGFTPIYQAMISDEYRNASALTNIYTFADVLKNRLPINDSGAIEDLMRAHNIFGTGSYAIGETNDGGQSISLPVYHDLTVGAKVNVCSNKTPKIFNGIGVRRLLKLEVSQDGSYNILAQKTRGRINSDPDIIIYKNGSEVFRLESSSVDIENRDSVQLKAGDYILEFYDANNLRFVSGRAGGLSCFDVSVL